MPLLKGKKNIGRNIKELESTGRSYSQSLAISLKEAGKSKKGSDRRSAAKTVKSK